MIVLHKEMRFQNRWEHINSLYLKDTDIDWGYLHSKGDVVGRTYSVPTELDIAFHQPECYIHHWDVTALYEMKQAMRGKFDLILGFWPWDVVDAWFDETDKNTLISAYGITAVRMVGWKV